MYIYRQKKYGGVTGVIKYIRLLKKKTGAKEVIDKTGDNAPYNGEPQYSINTEMAKGLGFRFSVLHNWIYELLDYYIELTD